MHLRILLPGMVAAALLVSGGCGNNESRPMGPMSPSGVIPLSGGPHLMSVAPVGGAVGVPTTTVLTAQFGTPMAFGMEQYIDLHRGDLDGGTVPIGCRWSDDRRTVTCTPHEPLQAHERYCLHLGGGMATQSGEPVEFDAYGPMHGGQWVEGGMMGGTHAGQPWGHMGSGWHHDGRGYGMAFIFTTS